MAITFSFLLRTDCILVHEVYDLILTFGKYIWQMVAALFC